MTKACVRIFPISLILILIACQTEIKAPILKNTQSFSQRIIGNTQGTTYEIKFIDTNQSVTKKMIDSLLRNFDLELSGYIDESILTKLNKGEITSIPQDSKYFIPCFELSKSIYEKTNGAFDPTVFPLIKLWGFFKSPNRVPQQSKIDSALQNVGFEKMSLDGLNLNIKQNPTLDFNAIAQGYSIDVVAEFLKGKGFENFYIEIGGEISVYGSKPNNENWNLGIDRPIENSETGERTATEIITFQGTNHIATSGNYRKFFEVDGVKYGHSINPKTGHPVQHNLRSVTVVAPSCAEADAYATAFMVMGTKKTLEFLNQNQSENVDCFLLYESDNGKLKDTMSQGFNKYLIH